MTQLPEALRDPLKKELDEFEKQGIIARVDEPIHGVNSLVCVTKSNGALRLCIDPKDLNRAIKRPHHCTPTLDEVLPKLNGVKYFSIIETYNWITKAHFTPPLTHRIASIDFGDFHLG